jgi:hypothetical protein
MERTPILHPVRAHQWFGGEKLLPGERMVRRCPARMLSTLPPHRWQGDIFLTTRRVFFLPETDHPLLERAAFWLEDVLDARLGGGTRLVASTWGRLVVFELPLSVRRDTARSWAASVVTLSRIARSRIALGTGIRHAAG